MIFIGQEFKSSTIVPSYGAGRVKKFMVQKFRLSLASGS
jgi:hypothetical protein